MTTGTLDLSRVDAERRRLESATELPPEDRPSPHAPDLDIDPATRAHRIVEQVLAEANWDGGTRTSSDVDEDEGSPDVVANRIVREVLAAEAATASRLEGSDRGETTTSAEVPGAAGTVEPDWQPSAHRRHLVLLGVEDPIVLVPGPVYESRASAFVPTELPVSLEGLVDRVLSSLDARPATSQDVRQALRGAAESEALPGSRWLVLGVLWATALAAATPFAAAALGSAIDFRIDLWGDQPATVQEADAGTAADAAPAIDATN